MVARRMLTWGLLAAACTLASGGGAVLVAQLVPIDPGKDGGPAVPASKTAELKKLASVAGFPDWVTSVRFSPDGKRVAAGSKGQVRLIDVASKSAKETLTMPSGFVRALAFSPDGTRLVAGGYQTVVVWDAASGKQLAALKGHRGFVTGAAFSPDGSLLATSSEDQTVRTWSGTDFAERRTLTDFAYPVQAVAFSPDGKVLATACGDPTRVTKPGLVQLWQAESGEPLASLPEHKRAATDVCFSPDGKFLVTTSEDEAVNVYDVAAQKALGFFGKHGRPTNGAVFSHDGRLVVSAAGGRAKGNNTVKVWTRTEGEELASVEAHTGRVTCVALSPDGRTIASGGHDKTVALWDGSVVPGLPVKPVEAVAAVAPPANPGQAPGTQPAKETKPASETQPAPATKTIRVGIIGLDTSHVIAFTKVLNDEKAPADVAGCRVVAAYPKGSPDIVSSTSRVAGYTEQMKGLGVEIVDSIDALLGKVDAVLLETNDGRPHLEQVRPVLKAGKPVFVDKPLSGSLADAVAIFELAKKHKVPLFSSSSLRYSAGAQELRKGKVGEILGCDAYGPCTLEPTHPDLFWYGIHGTEILFTVMGPGCETVVRAGTPDADVVVGTWSGGRIGTYRGIRKGTSGYGGTAFGTKGIEPVGKFDGYRPLVVEIVKCFRTGAVPIDERETLELYAFMEAADESKRQGGRPVAIADVLAKARTEAAKKIAE